MKTLKETIEDLVKEHGIKTFMDAVVEAGIVKAPLEDPKPVCPPHTYWNGHACVVDIG